MNRKKITAALLCLTLIGLLLSGCVKVETAGTVGDTQVPKGEFSFYYISYLINQMNSNSITTYDQLKDLQVDGQPVFDKAAGEAYKTYAKNQAAQKLFNDMGQSFDATAENAVNSTINSVIENTGGRDAYLNILKQYNMSEEDYFNVQKAYYINSMVQMCIYGDEGTQPVSDADGKALFNEQYVRIKHILISTMDTTTYQPYDEAKKQEQTDKAKEIYDKIMAGEDFESFMDQNEDPGMTSYPNGYIFGPNASYVQSFKDAAFDMKVGDVRLVESDYGWHIMKKYETAGDESFYESVKSEVKAAIAAERYDSLLDSKIEGVEIKKDQNKIDSINVQSILFGE